MKTFLFTLLIFICGLTISCTEDGHGYGNIYGVVTASDSAEPMRGIGVELYKSESLLLKTITYDDGHFEFDDLTSGNYILKVVADGYEELEYQVLVESNRTARADMQLIKLDTGISVVTAKSEAKSNGTVIFYGDYTYYYHGSTYNVNEIGFIYGQSSNLNSSNGTFVKSNKPSDNNYFIISEVKGLCAGKWYVMAYAKNNIGYAFGDIISFEISGAPDVETLEVKNITETTATLNGQVVYEGDPKYTEKGFVYSSSFPNPTVDDPESATTKVIVTGNGKDFSANISNLTKDKTYYVRAYATRDAETVYGKTVSFIAASPKPYIVIDNLAIQRTDLSKGATMEYADYLCAQSRVGGFSDWRLPTLGELEFIYKNKDIIGGFESSEYWSSTTYGQNAHYLYYFYTIDFKDGYTYHSLETSTLNVRAVRTIQ